MKKNPDTNHHKNAEKFKKIPFLIRKQLIPQKPTTSILQPDQKRNRTTTKAKMKYPHTHHSIRPRESKRKKKSTLKTKNPDQIWYQKVDLLGFGGDHGRLELPGMLEMGVEGFKLKKKRGGLESGERSC